MLKEKFKDYSIILASASPRRQQFFTDLGLDFEIKLKEVDEIYPDNLQHHQITDYLAHLKSDAFKDELLHKELVVTSDTIVWHNNKAVGKPKDFDDAFKILKSLSGQTHEVITSVCFRTINNISIINDISKVTFNKLSDQDITYYINNYHPFDKAGAYGIQDWIGLIGVLKIEGSYSNIMGLPVAKVYQYLQQLILEN